MWALKPKAVASPYDLFRLYRVAILVINMPMISIHIEKYALSLPLSCRFLSLPLSMDIFTSFSSRKKSHQVYRYRHTYTYTYMDHHRDTIIHVSRK